jgi:hypothetical protein
MKLEKYALIAEIISATAVTISLVFVGLQIRDNTISNEAATFQATVGHDIAILTSAGSSPDTARIFYAYRDNPDNLDGNEFLQGQALFTALARHVENLYLQHEAGMLSDAGWVARQPFVQTLVLSPGYENS